MNRTDIIYLAVSALLMTISFTLAYLAGAVIGYRRGFRSAPTPKKQRARQHEVLLWAINAFGPSATNRDERAARVAEEAIELAQAGGVPIDVVQRIAARVYERPVGEIGREIGGVAITLEAFAENTGYDVEQERNTEWQRVLTKPIEWWRAKHEAKVAAGTADLTRS